MYSPLLQMKLFYPLTVIDLLQHPNLSHIDGTIGPYTAQLVIIIWVAF